MMATQQKAPCAHPVNFGGLCGVCGKDLTVGDGSGDGRQDGRVGILMSHEHTRLTVSQEEAARIELETTKRLIKSKRLSLILDLDQTVIHASIQPEIEAWLQDPNMKTHPSLQNIHRFTLPDSPGMYYVKLRPGLHEFLTRISDCFELHIYTMGTRNYAAEISRIIDPHGSIFKERVLSRDESGSMTQKTIKRLFPCDDSMVVVVDDRADVWQWSPSLVKVRPYHFFVGTGDINAPPDSKPFVSPSPELTRPTLADQTVSQRTHEADKDWQKDMREQLPPPPAEPFPFTPSTVDLVAAPNDGISDGNDTTAPEVAKDSDEETAKAEQGSDFDNIIDRLVGDSASPAPRLVPFLLQDTDDELFTLCRVLEELNQTFYKMYDAAASGGGDSVDVKKILPKMKARVLQDVEIVFSGVFPLGSQPESAEIWLLATSFGAVCRKSVTRTTTHLVAANAGTEKVRQFRHMAEKHDGLVRHIVRPEWIYDSVSRWCRQQESLYSLNDQLTSLPRPTSPHGPSMSGDVEKDEWPSSSVSSTASALPSTQLTTMDPEALQELNRELEEEMLDFSSSSSDNEYDRDESDSDSEGGSAYSQLSSKSSTVASGSYSSSRATSKNPADYIPRRKSPLQQYLVPLSGSDDDGSADESVEEAPHKSSKVVMKRRRRKSPSGRSLKRPRPRRVTSNSQSSGSGTATAEEETSTNTSDVSELEFSDLAEQLDTDDW